MSLLAPGSIRPHQAPLVQPFTTTDGSTIGIDARNGCVTVYAGVSAAIDAARYRPACPCLSAPTFTLVKLA
ncbi:hypothetical protein H2248_002928 [Termitomyces sp. 'cryptogamus']|nr:hypothetical protein H2248_002928 [Termitomyces sp. 'cryptogamus']